MTRRVFIVEDEVQIARVLSDYLTRSGYRTEVFHDGESALQAFIKAPPDLMIVDLMLPKVDGLTLCREVRKSSELPIILATAKVEEMDRLIGLESGADDYVCKPFSPREVVARVKANLKRWPGAEGTTRTSGLQHQVESQRYLYDGSPLNLTQTEYKILALLEGSPGRIFSRAHLLDFCYDPDQNVSDRAIDSHVKNLRKKLRAVHTPVDLIHSVYGMGYRFESA